MKLKEWRRCTNRRGRHSRLPSTAGFCTKLRREQARALHLPHCRGELRSPACTVILSAAKDLRQKELAQKEIPSEAQNDKFLPFL